MPLLHSCVTCVPAFDPQLLTQAKENDPEGSLSPMALKVLSLWISTPLALLFGRFLLGLRFRH
jgi:hypothetical protein